MKIKLPQYSSKDYYVMMWVMLPLTILLNSILFGKLYYSNWQVFILATLISGVGACIDFIICGYVAVALRNRFPRESQFTIRLGLMIITFLLLTGLFLYTLFRGYEAIHFFGYTYYEAGFVWSYIAMGIMNIFITLVHEGISRYKNWRANLLETDALKVAYRQSQLQGLKSQVNPHFLFNSLNSLSSLISDDEEKAEAFLNEMSKVYRYMLRNEEDKLVELGEELKFIYAYTYLLKARYGESLMLFIDIKKEDESLLIPPLTMQVIIENIVNQNALSKTAPLRISITTNQNGMLCIYNNVKPKIVTEMMDHERGLDNLVNKFRLLNDSKVVIEESEYERIILLPLIKKMEEEPV